MSVEGISQYDETALYYTTRHKAIHQRMPGSMALVQLSDQPRLDLLLSIRAEGDHISTF